MKMTTACVALSAIVLSTNTTANELGSLSANFNLRSETVDQQNALKDAHAMTLRTRITYKTPTLGWFSAIIEGENSLTLHDSFNDALGSNPGYSVVADPETTELDQVAIILGTKTFKATVGRQVITLDDHRFVGHVGWRQDRQTFDAASVKFNPSDKASAYYAYVTKRNRIFAKERDLDSEDHLLNVSYQFGGAKLTGFGYLLSEDEGVERDIDTWGIKYANKVDVGGTPLNIDAQYATQSADILGSSYDADYWQGKLTLNAGCLKWWLGGELLGSDDGMYGFSTPLATLHKFNGWSDQFLGTPATGLLDIHAGVGGKYQGINWSAAYHDFSADEGDNDFGGEVNASVSTKLNKRFTVGAKYASFNADSNGGKVDTSKAWVWVSMAL